MAVRATGPQRTRATRTNRHRLVARHATPDLLSQHSPQSPHEQQNEQQQGTPLGLGVVSVCVVMISLVVVALCVRRRQDSSADTKFRFSLLRKRAGRRRRSPGTQDVYEDAVSVGPLAPRFRVDSAGYMDVECPGDGCPVELLAEGASAPSEYNRLGNHLLQIHSEPAPSCRAYDHVIVPGTAASRSASHCETGRGGRSASARAMTSLRNNGSAGMGTGTQATPPVRNEYDVSVVAKETQCRPQVIDGIYDRLRNGTD